jgi:hypothetical protein
MEASPSSGGRSTVDSHLRFRLEEGRGARLAARLFPALLRAFAAPPIPFSEPS